MKDNYKIGKKRLILALLAIILGLGITLGAVYFVYVNKDSRENKLVSSLVSINFSETNGLVNLTGQLPVIDDVGIKNNSYTFTLQNTSDVSIDSEIKLELDDDNTNIPLGAVRYAFYINDELKTKDYIHDNLVLYKKEDMAASETLNCKLVFWIDYYYDGVNKDFSAKIIANGNSKDIVK